MNVKTVEIKIQLSTLLSNVRSPNCLPKILNWFNLVNECQISPTTEETLFSITASSLDTTTIRNNYTASFLCHYNYSNKLNSLTMSIQDFISKLLIKCDLENVSLIR